MQQPNELLQRLQTERDRLRTEVSDVASRPAEFRPTRESFYGNHLADSASDMFEDEKAMALGAHLNGMLSRVEAALSNFEAGTYGTCARCGKPIAPERLEALPSATTCVACATPTRRHRPGSSI